MMTTPLIAIKVEMLAQALIEYAMLEPVLLAMDSFGRWLGSWFFGTWSVSKLVITGVIGVCLWFFLSRPK